MLLLRAKAKAQKLKKSGSTSTSTSNSQSPSPTKKPITPKPKAQVVRTMNNNFPEERIDAIEYMEITRRNKLRKRKKKVENKYKIDPTSSNSRRLNLNKPKTPKFSKEPDVLSSTPILSAMDGKNVNAPKINAAMSQKRARLAFRLNGEVELQNYFSYDDKLVDVMMYIVNETGLTDFLFISQYPPLNIDSIYLDRKMEEQGRSLFRSSQDEKSNESQYDEVQETLQKTLYELNLVPSCRIFIRAKYKGHKAPAGEVGIIGKIVNAIIEIIKMGGDGIYQIIVLILGLIWSILKIPLGLLGIVKNDGGGTTTTNTRQNYSTPPQSQSNNKRNKSKLPSFRKDRRFGGGSSNVMRLSHLERDDDKNRLSNGNSTMYGGDGDK